MIFKSPGTIYIDRIPTKIFGEVFDYYVEVTASPPLPIRQLKSFNDHMMMISSLDLDYPNLILKQLRERFISDFENKIINDDHEIVLSDLPSIVLQCQWIDKGTLMYRLDIMKGLKIENWKTLSGPNIRQQVSSFVFDRLVKFGNYQYLMPSTYQKDQQSGAAKRVS